MQSTPDPQPVIVFIAALFSRVRQNKHKKKQKDPMFTTEWMNTRGMVYPAQLIVFDYRKKGTAVMCCNSKSWEAWPEMCYMAQTALAMQQFRLVS